jgi:hypothetical protein
MAQFALALTIATSGIAPQWRPAAASAAVRGPAGLSCASALTRGDQFDRRGAVTISWAALASAALATQPAPSFAAQEVLVEGEVSLAKLAPQLKGKSVHVEVIARRLGKGVIATKKIDIPVDEFPARFFIYAEDITAGINLENTRTDDIFLLATLDVPDAAGKLKRVAQVQGKAPLKKGLRLKPLLELE